jgi:hypothetical protein
MSSDITILRELAKRYAQAAAKPVHDQRRDLWRRHNGLVATRPLVICTGLFFWHELGLYDNLQCRDPLFRQFETEFKVMLLRDRLDDDFVIEPYVVVPAVYGVPSGQDRWGARIVFSELTAKGGSFKMLPPIKEESDFDKLVAYPHVIDEPATARQFARLHEAIGDIVPLAQSRAPVYSRWVADISTDLARLRGLEQIMWDMLDRPRWLHRLCAFLRDGVIQQQDQAQAAGHWRKFNSFNQAVNYGRDLPDPTAEDQPVGRDRLWCFMAAQEMAQVSPAMHEEFILQYQLPIMAKFGLVAYGCCEDLTHKIDMLRRIPNLRRIAVTPWANVSKCAEQIGTDYVMSWRPSPAEMICNGFDPARIKRVIRQGLTDARGCHVDITLKDVQTIAGNFDNLIEWVRIVRGIIDESA